MRDTFSAEASVMTRNDRREDALDEVCIHSGRAEAAERDLYRHLAAGHPRR